MERFSDEAVVLSVLDYGEADRIVTLFTRERGRITAFAAGARKSKRRFAGALEPSTHLKVQLVERRGSTMRLDSADILGSFPRLRAELPLIARALYCVELARELTREHEPHPELYALLVNYLTALDARQAGPTSLIAFELTALMHAGLMPRFDVCALCGEEAGEAPRFDPAHGGAVCGACALRSREGVRVAPELLQALRALQEGGRTPMAAPERQRARELLNLFIAHQLGRKLKSVEFMAQLGLD